MVKFDPKRAGSRRQSSRISDNISVDKRTLVTSFCRHTSRMTCVKRLERHGEELDIVEDKSRL